ncbi:MAG: hypothetical protein JSS65_04550 [Armatimonadetes bacterium]|nr:hypothetical protein [Armatimonadota bacterium]
MPASPDRIGLFVIKFVVVPAILAAVGYFVIGPVVGSMTAADKPGNSDAQLAALKQQAEQTGEATDASRNGQPVNAPKGSKEPAREPDVDLSVEKEAPAPAKAEKPPVEEPPVETLPETTAEGEATVEPAKPPKAKPETTKPAPAKPAGKPKATTKKDKPKPTQKLPDTPEVGDGTGD